MGANIITTPIPAEPLRVSLLEAVADGIAPVIANNMMFVAYKMAPIQCCALNINSSGSRPSLGGSGPILHCFYDVEDYRENLSGWFPIDLLAF